MNILVLGGGSREHSICHELSMSNKVRRVYCTPGNAKIALVSKIAKIDANNFISVLKFCKNKNISMVIPGSEEYLEKGISDFLIMEGISVIGPSKFASSLETSNILQKVCDLSGIKTTKWIVCDSAKQAKKIIKVKSFL